MSNEPLAEMAHRVFNLLRKLLFFASILTLAGCASHPPVQPGGGSPGGFAGADFPNAKFSGAQFTGSPGLSPATANQPDWDQVAEKFYQKFHTETNEDSFAKKITEKIGDKILDKEIENSIDAIHKKLFGASEAPGISACCDELKNASQALAGLRGDLSNTDSAQRQIAQQQLIALNNLSSTIDRDSADLGRKLSGLGGQLSNIFHLGIGMIVLSILQLFAQFAMRSGGTGTSPTSRPDNPKTRPPAPGLREERVYEKQTPGGQTAAAA
jgi:hypothetical protein